MISKARREGVRSDRVDILGNIIGLREVDIDIFKNTTEDVMSSVVGYKVYELGCSDLYYVNVRFSGRPSSYLVTSDGISGLMLSCFNDFNTKFIVGGMLSTITPFPAASVLSQTKIIAGEPSNVSLLLTINKALPVQTAEVTPNASVSTPPAIGNQHSVSQDDDFPDL